MLLTDLDNAVFLNRSADGRSSYEGRLWKTLWWLAYSSLELERFSLSSGLRSALPLPRRIVAVPTSIYLEHPTHSSQPWNPVRPLRNRQAHNLRS